MTTEKPLDDLSATDGDADQQADQQADHGDGAADASVATSGSTSGALGGLAARLRGASDGGRGRLTRLPAWQQAVVVVVLAVILAVVVKALFVQVFTVPTASMEPTIKAGDKVVVAKPPYWFGGTPSRGDVVVFKDPGGWLGNSDRDHTTGVAKVLSVIGLYPSGGHLVKRVIGVAGDTVTCCDEQGRIQVNGYALDESGYTSPTYPDGGRLPCLGPMYNNCTWTSGVIPKGDLFVMGDSRGDSADSSVHLECVAAGSSCKDSPFVPVGDVVGKVVSDGWHVLHRPADFADVPNPN